MFAGNPEFARRIKHEIWRTIGVNHFSRAHRGETARTRRVSNAVLRKDVFVFIPCSLSLYPEVRVNPFENGPALRAYVLCQRPL